MKVEGKGISASSEISAQAQKDMHVVPFDETNADRRAKAKAELEARNILFKNNKEARELEARISEANDYLPTDNTSQILLLTDRLHVEMERINKNLAAFNQFSKESSTIDVSDTIKALDLATTTAPATQNQNNEDKLYGLDILEQNRENNGITDKFMKVDFNQPLTPLTPLTKEGLALLTEKSTLTAVSKRTNKEIFKDANDKQKAAALAKKKLEQYRKQTNDTMADNQEQTLRELEKEVLRTEKEAITADAEANRLVQQHLADSAKAEPATTEPQAQQKVIPATAEPTTTATTQNQNNEYKLYGLQVLERSEGSEGSEGSKGSLEFSSDGSVQSDVTEKADNLSQSRPTLWSATKGFGNTIKDTMLARVLPQRK